MSRKRTFCVLAAVGAAVQTSGQSACTNIDHSRGTARSFPLPHSLNRNDCRTIVAALQTTKHHFELTRASQRKVLGMLHTSFLESRSQGRGIV